MNWKDVQKIIREELSEETNVTADNTTFVMRTGVNKNPTKLGLKIQFTPKEGGLDRDTKARLAQVLQSKLSPACSNISSISFKASFCSYKGLIPANS